MSACIAAFALLLATRFEEPVFALAGGVLTGKYLGGARPANARLTRFPDYDRYSSPQAQQATHDYVALARDAGLSPTQMALAYVCSRPFVTSNIIGATTLDQLGSNLASIDLHLSDEVLEAMRLLTDLQSQTRPVLQLVLFGQEELEGAMSAPGMEQFQHRVIASCRLQPMDLSDCGIHRFERNVEAYREGAVGATGGKSGGGCGCS